MIYDGDTFEHAGLSFRVSFVADTDHDAPWDAEDGHGPVSDWTSRGKAPGEMILAQDGGYFRYYDLAEACRIAQRDGWDAHPYNDGRESKRQQAAKAAFADFERLRAWCNDVWSYIGVSVELLDKDGDGTGLSESLWGIEDDAGEYLASVARELADELLPAATFRPAA